MRFENKIVFITGASSGIGRACAEQFAQCGAKLLICARRTGILNEFANHLKEKYNATVLPVTLDVSNVEAVSKVFSQIPAEWQDIDILVNNAGFSLGLDKIQQAKLEHWEQMINTNIKGLLYITRQVLQRMVARNKGHIINIGSISAHEVYSGGVVYCATKFAVRAISEGLKMDVHGTPIRVTHIDPGMTETNFSLVRFGGDAKKAAAIYEGAHPLVADDIADAIIYCASRPPHVDIREMKIYPTAQTAIHLVARDGEKSEGGGGSFGNL